MRHEIAGIFVESPAHHRLLQSHAGIFGRFSLRQHLQPDVAHFIFAAWPGTNAPWWMVRITRIGVRVIVRDAHLNRRSFRKPNWLAVRVDPLPVDVPVRDLDQRDARAIGQGSPGFHLLAELVRVRVDGQHFDANRQRHMICHADFSRARLDIDSAVVFELHQHGL